MSLLFWACVIGLLIYIETRVNKKPDNIAQKDNVIRQSNRRWFQFVSGYRSIAKSEAEKKLIDRMLDDLRTQKVIDELDERWLEDITAKPRDVDSKNQAEQPKLQAAAALTTSAHSEWAANSGVARETRNVRLDNISLLLYFGAFLFVAAAGLFVAFAGASGWARTLTVLAVTLALYVIGQWIYNTKQALKPAGLAFVGIGIAIAPLVGVAAHNYVTNTTPSLIWFMTSVLCLLLYGHALVSLRKPLISYVFIFTLLSLFESGVAISNAPIYYFGWAMAALGLLLQFVSTWKHVWPEFREPTAMGGQLYVPLAVFVSLATTPTQGFSQLGVSLLLASLYYGLQYIRAKAGPARESYALTTHVTLLLGLSSLVYGASHEIGVTGIFLASVSIAHVVVLKVVNRNTPITQNIATIMLGSTLASLVMLIDNFPAFTVVLASCVLQSLFVWWCQRRHDAYVLAALAWSVLPGVFGKLALSPVLAINQLIAVSVIAFTAHIIFYITVVRPRLPSEHRNFVQSALLLNLMAVAGTIVFASAGVVLVALLSVSLALLMLSLFDKDNVWEIVSGFLLVLAVACSWNDVLLSTALIVALTYNIFLALRFRSEANRWISTLLWLLWPIGLGGLTTSQHWGTIQYAWSYIAVMSGLVISRAIARGAVFPSSKIQLTAYAKTASLSYVFGYMAAGCLAVFISLFSVDSQLHTTAILGVISIIIFVLTWRIEKQPVILAVQPVLWQLMLLSGIRPSSTELLATYVFASTLLAVLSYGVYRLLVRDEVYGKYITPEIGQIAVFTAFIAPSAFFFADTLTWAMPLGLFVAGMLLFDYWRDHMQAYKEAAVGTMVAAGMWMLYFFGVREVQAYSHILAGTLAGFAWWRYALDDKQSSDGYIYAALGTATIPLLLQSLSSSAGGVYGWWLLIEQVMFMLIGMAIRKRFVIMWGLYVAVGAVLYQLRDLGYAALAVLAIFIIGIAIYQLQKYNKPE